MSQQDEIERAVARRESLSDVSTGFFDFPGKKDYRLIWNTIRDTGRMFKGTKFDNRAVREDFWECFQAVVEHMKQEHEEYSRAMDRKMDRSASHLAHIQRILPSPGEDGAGDLALLLATNGLSMSVKAAVDMLPGEFDEERDRLQRARAAVKEAGQNLSANKAEMLRKHKDAAFEKIKSTREQLDREWDAYKGRRQQARSAQQEAHASRQRE